jgi:GNAT superfamily N-acetyltransferase
MCARFARYDDLEGIMDLYEVLIPDDTLASLDHLKTVWDHIMSNPELYRYAVAEENGRLVATSNITIVPNLTRSGRPYAVIENVVTHPSARRRGFGRETMELLLDYAKEKNCYKVILLSSSHRAEAHKFYESLGFDGDAKRGYTYYMK